MYFIARDNYVYQVHLPIIANWAYLQPHLLAHKLNITIFVSQYKGFYEVFYINQIV